MDLDGVRLFVLAAETANISAAGRTLGMGAAVASGKLAKLERALGADLLRRSTRKVALSLEGREFLPFARELIAQEDAARAALGLAMPEAKGELRFTAPSTFAQLYIAPLLPRFLAAHPGVSLDLRLSDARLDLIEGAFDLALRNSATVDSALKSRVLARDERVLCASPSYLAARGRPNSPADLAQHDLVAFKDKAARPLVTADGADGVFDPSAGRCRVVVDDGLSQKIATIAGAGVSANSLWSVQPELRSGALVRVLPSHRVDDGSSLQLIYPKANVLSAKVRVFIDFLLDHIGRAPPWGER